MIKKETIKTTVSIKGNMLLTAIIPTNKNFNSSKLVLSLSSIKYSSMHLYNGYEHWSSVIPKKSTATTPAAAPAAPAATAKADTPKTKKVCVDVQGKDGKPVIDPKTKKPKQNCKDVKVREKHEGTAVPEKKK